MADTKITALTAISTVDPAIDVLPIVDVSDTTMAASGTTKKITSNQILGAGGTATLASATISGDLTVDTSTLKVDSTNNRVGIGTASPSYILDILGASPRLHIRDNGTGSSLLDIENGAGTFYVGRENSTGSGGLSGVPYAGILYLQGAYPIICGTNFTERYRIASDGVATWSNVGGVAGTAMTLNSTGLLVGTTSDLTGANISSSKGLGTANIATNRFATVEYGSGASGVFTTITISFAVTSTSSTVIIEALLTGFSGVYLDHVAGKYSNQAGVVIRNNASVGTSVAALAVDGTGLIYTLTITTSVTHPVIKVKATVGGLGQTVTLPVITFA